MNIEEPRKFTLVEKGDDYFGGLDPEGRYIEFPMSAYYRLKYMEKRGERISHNFSEKIYIMETFDDGIYNCTFNKQQMQISDAEAIAEVILNKDVKAFESLFVKWYSIKMQAEIVQSMLGPFKDRITIVDGRFAIDGIFAVDKHAQAWEKRNGSWKSLCIVTNLRNTGTRIAKLPGLGKVEINDLTMIIISKIDFLLFPNLNDSVFTNQLTEASKKHIRGQ